MRFGLSKGEVPLTTIIIIVAVILILILIIIKAGGGLSGSWDKVSGTVGGLFGP